MSEPGSSRGLAGRLMAPTVWPSSLDLRQLLVPFLGASILSRPAEYHRPLRTREDGGARTEEKTVQLLPWPCLPHGAREPPQTQFPI